MKDKIITREHGYGGNKTRELIEKIILPEISNPYADKMDDAAVLPFTGKSLIFTTDGFVVNPPFFPGGDIGKLAVSGTVNDILAQGGKPLYISLSMILEEGFEIEKIKKITISAAREAAHADIKIVCGDIKVVEKGSGDGIYITAAGIGKQVIKLNINEITENDMIILTGTAGEHGAAIFQARNKLLDETVLIKSDCTGLPELLKIFAQFGDYIKFMRDPTRGGVAEIILELAQICQREIEIKEKNIPVSDWVKGLAYIAGLDYLYLASEGRMLIVATQNKSSEIVDCLKKIGFLGAAVIGKIGSCQKNASSILKTTAGGSRILSASDIVQIPRIC